MDIKLKNNSKTRILITAAALFLLVLLTFCFFPALNRSAQRITAERQEAGEQTAQVDSELLKEIYKGCYVLYMETVLKQEGWENKTAADVFLKEIPDQELDSISESDLNRYGPLWIKETLDAWTGRFENYRTKIDYCIILEGGSVNKNTVENLENAVLAPDNKDKMKRLSEYYSDLFVLTFDESGMLEVEPVYSDNADQDALIKTLQQIDRRDLLRQDIYAAADISEFTMTLETPRNFQVIFGVSRAMEDELAISQGGSGRETDYWQRSDYVNAGAGYLYVAFLVLIGILMFCMTNQKLWKTEISMNRPYSWYLMEAAVIGIIVVISMEDVFIQILAGTKFESISEFIKLVGGNGFYGVTVFLASAMQLFCIYGLWYLSLRFIRPVFTLGLREYIRQYSFLYQIFPWLKKKWDHFREEVGHIDFSERSTRVIVKVVIINFLVLSACTFLWFFGIGALLVYSVVLFFVLKKYCRKVGRDYQTMLWAVNKMAEGDLDTEIMTDLGIFEPFRYELGKVRAGFKKAVDEEVKSQRMKTELITNVSHDLKTPLTAITTYIELLKKEDITEEERRSYIETLEKKSLRLKVLIEDLFEVSKATSNNITLNLMEVDVVNLMKQVSIEHADQFDAAGLKLLWDVPEEKVTLMLDNQKTYRIFENLFVNAQKYAMPNSRVYVDVKKQEDMLEIAMKNMSAAELNFKADEITERFVRGDASRNTEGSGLGLAIAKSFTEAQGGKLRIEVDGDLFKVVIQWKCGNI